MAWLVVGERDPCTRQTLRDRCQRCLDGIESQVHRDPDPREHRLPREIELGALQTLAQGLMLEIYRGKDEVCPAS